MANRRHRSAPCHPGLGSEPAVNEYDLAGINEGNIIVEVTIDERGNITQKTVLQSLNSAIDHKVLAALGRLALSTGSA